MKKMMVFIAALACAMGLQAAQIQWGGAIAADAAQSATLPAGTQAFLLWSDSAISQPASFDGKTGLVSTYTLTGNDSDAWAFSATYDKPGADVNGFYAVLVQNGDKYSFFNAGQVTGTTAASAPTDLRVNGDWSGNTALTDGGFVVAQGGGVPEPTSGLLLLIGGAMLALRRKQK